MDENDLQIIKRHRQIYLDTLEYLLILIENQTKIERKESCKNAKKQGVSKAIEGDVNYKLAVRSWITFSVHCQNVFKSSSVHLSAISLTVESSKYRPVSFSNPAFQAQ